MQNDDLIIQQFETDVFVKHCQQNVFQAMVFESCFHRDLFKITHSKEIYQLYNYIIKLFWSNYYHIDIMHNKQYDEYVKLPEVIDYFIRNKEYIKKYVFWKEKNMSDEEVNYWFGKRYNLLN